MNNWKSLDPGTSDLILVGPMLKSVLKPENAGKHIPLETPQIAIDRGIEFSFQPIFWCGDGDSSEIPTQMNHLIKTDQNETDLRFCLNGIKEFEWKHLHLFGFLGGRRDHELANFGEIMTILDSRASASRATFYDEKLEPSVRFFQKGIHQVFLEGTFSMMVFESAFVSISGACHYSAQNLSLQPFSGRGLSNVGSGNVTIESNQSFIII